MQEEIIIEIQIQKELTKLINTRNAYTALQLLKTLNQLQYDNISYRFNAWILKSWIDKNIPHEHLTFTDIDFLARRYEDSNMNKDRIMLIEFKHGNKPFRLHIKQHRPFSFIDNALKEVYPKNYYGFHVITLDNYDLNNASSIYINNTKVTVDELKDLLMFKRRYNSYFKD